MDLSFVQRIEQEQMEVSRPVMTRELQLRFSKSIYQPFSTGVPIKGSDSKPLMVSLINGQSGQVVKSGPEASAKVEIVALKADFGGGGNWTREEFKSNIVTKEENKRLLTGNVTLNLNKGIGYVGIIGLSHTKKWKRKCAYKLGAMVVNDDIGTKINEGLTDSFVVKDRRLNLNEKHHPPNLSSEVWRLDGIAKDGVFHHRLSVDPININTVEDLLKKLNTDPKMLRDVLGKSMSDRKWETLVAHAQKCIFDKRLHFYSSSGSHPKSDVLFNVVGQVIGIFSGSQYIAFEMLSESEKDHAVNLVDSAFQQWDKVVSFDHEASFMDYLESSNFNYYLIYSASVVDWEKIITLLTQELVLEHRTTDRAEMDTSSYIYYDRERGYM